MQVTCYSANNCFYHRTTYNLEDKPLSKLTCRQLVRVNYLTKRINVLSPRIQELVERVEINRNLVEVRRSTELLSKLETKLALLLHEVEQCSKELEELNQ